MKERITRLAIIVLVVFLVVGAAKAFSDWQGKQATSGQSISSPIKKKIEGLGEEILGKAVEVLPGAPDLEEVISENQTGQVQGEQDEVVSSSEPIQEPVQNIQKQTEVLVETIKELPQGQIEAIKKQIYKDFCEKLIQEE